MGDIRLNPHYFPRTGRGRPGTKKYKKLAEQVFDFGRGRPRKPMYWKADLFRKDESQIDSIIGQGTKQTAFAEAQNMVGKMYKGEKIAKVMLDGPFETIDDIAVDEEFETEFTPRSVSEMEVMEAAATMRPAPRGTVKIIAPKEDKIFPPKTSKKRGRKRIHSLTHKYKVGQIVLLRLAGRDTFKYAIVTSQSGASDYHLNVMYETGITSAKAIPENRIMPLPKGRPSEYVAGVIAALKASL